MANAKKDGMQETPKNTEIEQRPSWIPEGDATGTAMGIDEIRLPRLGIAQGLSPQLVPGKPEFIEGLSMFDMFNDVLGTNYKKKPLMFVPIRHDFRIIEFKPRSEGGGVIDMNVPPNDPRTQWTSDPNDPTKRVPPKATKFHEYVVFLIHDDGRTEPIVISIKDTNKNNRKAFKNLNTYIALPHPRFGVLPIYGKMYKLTVGTASNEKGTWGVPIVEQAGVLLDGNIGRAAMAFAKSLEGKNIVVQREPGDETEFDVASLEGQGATQAEM
jgi:hypothetical protein